MEPEQFDILKERLKPEYTQEESKKMLEEALKEPAVKHNTNKVTEIKKGKGLTWRQKRNLYKDPAFTHLATMMYNNRTCRTIIIKGFSPYFIHNKKGYLIYKPASFYDINQNQSHLYYAEGYIMPIESLKIIGGEEVSFAIHPDNFREIWESQELKIVLTAKSIKKWLFYLILITGFTAFAIILLVLIAGAPIVMKLFASGGG